MIYGLTLTKKFFFHLTAKFRFSLHQQRPYCFPRPLNFELNGRAAKELGHFSETTGQDQKAAANFDFLVRFTYGSHLLSA